MSGSRRNIEVKMRLNEVERDILFNRMHDAGIQNREAYLRQMALTGFILRLDLSEVRHALRLMSNATSNINQLTKIANETRSIYANDMVILQKEVKNLCQQISSVMRVFHKVHDVLRLLRGA